MEKMVGTISFLSSKKKMIGAIILYLIVLSIGFHSVIFGNKSLYPITYIGRSTEYLTSNKEILKNIDAGGIYADSGAADWVEIPILSTAVWNVQKGELPLWDNYNSLGMPIIDNNNGSTLAPLAGIIYTGNSEAAWNFMYLLRVFIIMLFTYLFLDELGIKYGPALVGGIIFGLSGYVMLYLNIFFMHVDAFLPMLMWMTLKYRMKPNIQRWIGCSIVVAAMCLGGNPQNLITCSLLAFCFFVFSLFSNYNGTIDKKIDKIKSIMLYIGSYILGVVLTLGYWFSFLTLYMNSYSYHGNSGIKSKTLIELLGFIIPKGNFVAQYRASWMPYIGIVVFSIIFLQLNWRRNKQFFKEKLFFGGFILIFILKILGFPLINWIGRLPVLNELTFTKYNSCIYFSIAVLAAIALNDMLLYTTSIRKRLQCYFFVILAFVVGIIYYSKMFDSVGVLSAYLKVISIILIFIAIAAVMCLFIKDKRIYFLLVGFVLCTELLSYPISNSGLLIPKGVALEEPKFVTELKVHQENDYDRVFCVGGLLVGNLSAIYKISSIGGVSPTPEIHYWNFMNEFILNHNINLQMVTTQSSAYYPESKRFLDMLGIKFFMIDDYGKLDDPSLVPVYVDDRLTIYKNQTAFEKAYIIHDIITVNNEDDAFAVMKNNNFDFSKSAVVERGSSIEEIQSIGTMEDTVDIIDYNANSVKIKCNLSSNGLLVLTDLYYPGWNVYTNGVKGEILRTNDILRGVYLESGENIVQFVYQPKALIIGNAIAFGTVILLTIGTIIFINRKKGEL